MVERLTLDHLRKAKAALDALGPISPQIRLIENPMLTIGPFEDWSDVRSPGRAARRRKQGHRQRIRFYYKPDPQLYHMADGSTFGHPATLAKLRAAISKDRPHAHR
jgi:hypothetical protein